MSERIERATMESGPRQDQGSVIERLTKKIEKKKSELAGAPPAEQERARAEIARLYAEREKAGAKTLADIASEAKKNPEPMDWEKFKKTIKKGIEFIKEASIYTGAAVGYGTFIWLRDSVRATFTAAWEITKSVITNHASEKLTKGWEPPKEHEVKGGHAAGGGSTKSHKEDAGHGGGKKGHGKGGHGETHGGGHGAGHGESHGSEHGGGHAEGHGETHVEGGEQKEAEAHAAHEAHEKAETEEQHRVQEEEHAPAHH